MTEQTKQPGALEYLALGILLPFAPLVVGAFALVGILLTPFYVVKLLGGLR